MSGSVLSESVTKGQQPAVAEFPQRDENLTSFKFKLPFCTRGQIVIGAVGTRGKGPNYWDVAGLLPVGSSAFACDSSSHEEKKSGRLSGTIIRSRGIVYKMLHAAVNVLGNWRSCRSSASLIGSGSGNIATSWNFTVWQSERASSHFRKSLLKNQNVFPKQSRRPPFLGLRSGSAFIYRLRGWA